MSPHRWGHGADVGPWGPSRRLLSSESPSGALKAVLRKAAGKEKEKEKQFLEVSWGPGGDAAGKGRGARAAPIPCLRPQVWDQNRKVKSIDLTALDKHGSIYDDGEG